jgi:hypothetical protein
VVVERVECRTERLHRRHRVDAKPLEPVAEPLEVVELRDRECRKSRLVLDRRSKGGVVGKPLERGELAVRKDPEQVDDGRTEDRILAARHAGGRRCPLLHRRRCGFLLAFGRTHVAELRSCPPPGFPPSGRAGERRS